MNTTRLTAILVAVLLTGCGTAPTLPRQGAAEPERKVSLSKLPARASAQATKAPTNATSRPTIDAPKEAAGSGAEAPPSTPTPAPTLQIVSRPDPLKVVPFRGADGVALNLLSEPADGLARFEILAPAAGVLVAKAKIELVGVAHPASVELTAADLGWPAKLAYRTALAVPVALYETLAVLSQDPTATRFTLRTTLVGPEGQALNGVDGEPLVLQATVSVL